MKLMKIQLQLPKFLSSNYFLKDISTYVNLIIFFLFFVFLFFVKQRASRKVYGGMNHNYTKARLFLFKF